MIGRVLVWSLCAVLGGLVLRRHLDVVEVRGRSMAPALLPGDRLLVARLAPRRVGDVAIAPDPRNPRRELVKRVSRLDATSVTLRGDNAAASTDARTFGTLPRSAVRWRVLGRYWPPERIGPVPSAAGASRSRRVASPPAPVRCSWPGVSALSFPWVAPERN